MTALVPLLREWQRAVDTAPEETLLAADAAGAESCGAHALAALLRLRDRLERSRGQLSGAEIVMHLTPIIGLARGEAQARLRMEAHDDTLSVPGLIRRVIF